MLNQNTNNLNELAIKICPMQLFNLLFCPKRRLSVTNLLLAGELFVCILLLKVT